MQGPDAPLARQISGELQLSSLLLFIKSIPSHLDILVRNNPHSQPPSTNNSSSYSDTRQFLQFEYDSTTKEAHRQPTPSIMPLDTSTYALSLLRLDGRRWNELRHLTAQISTQPSCDGSSYLSMGNTKVLCSVTGPCDPSKIISLSRGAGAGRPDRCEVRVDVNIAGFAGVDRKKFGRGDKYVLFPRMPLPIVVGEWDRKTLATGRC